MVVFFVKYIFKRLGVFLSVILLYLGVPFLPIKNRSVIYNAPSLLKLVMKVF